ncbi:MAG: DUF4010 domain-containing protein [Brevundimonas sp.]|jgi:uncharacterized membrane protein (DUF4010 family)|uniref:MgtC/SapB family protein n=1 Tax=Brevundimonas sp. TaxID=1871086 RepID=UPI0025C43903|nr:DUF4010 domain-containing protein [Brevundimonas sp.]MCH4267320.1 DUF4010 domain-containing protein [Brevundimonas sp.]
MSSPAPEVASILSQPEWPLFVALAIGLLIGLDRERRKGDGTLRSPAGLRTFALVGLLGGITALNGHAAFVVMTGAFVALAALMAYGLGDRKDLTGEVALVATFVLGVLAQTLPGVAFACAVVIAALLTFRVQLHAFVHKRISDQDLLDALIFAIAAIVILPLLPNRTIDPFALLNPYALWRLAVVAMALSFLGYGAQRLLGGRNGLLVAGLAAGLVSSTAAVAAMGARSKAHPSMAGASAAGALASMIGSLGYLAAIIGAVSPKLVLALAVPLTAAAGSMFAYAVLLVRRPAEATAQPEIVGRAFNLLAVVVFVGLVGGFSVASDLLIRWLGPVGAMVAAVVMGLADAHAAAVSMATLTTGARLTANAAAIGVVLALTANMAVKIPTAFLTGGPAYARRVTIGVGVLLTGLWLGVWAVVSF